MVTAAAQSGTLTGVEMFAVGQYVQADGTVQSYGEDYLDKVLANFGRLSTGPTPLHRVPVVVGHEGQEAYAWVDAVRRAQVHEGASLAPGLQGDWSEVEPTLKQAIKAGRYKKVSVEFKDDFTDNQGRTYGPCLWRVAVLGADIPKVKGLADLPAEQFADKSHSKFAERRLHFAEVSAMDPVPGMDRAGAIAYLTSKGIDAALITDAIPDELLIAIATAWQAAEAAAMQPPAPEGEALLAADGTPNRPASQVTVTKKFAEADVAALVQAAVARQLAGVNQQLALVTANLKEGQRATQTFAEAQKRKLVDDAVHKAIHVTKTALPAEDDPGLGPRRLSARLMRKDHSKLHAFSEGGVSTPKTELELEIDALLNDRRPHRFSEGPIRAGKAGAAGGGTGTVHERMDALAQQMAARNKPSGKSLEEKLGMLPARANR